METNATDERARFARDFLASQWSMTELCERYGVTRPTGYTWLARYRAGGEDALADRSRAPHHSPHRTAADLETLVLAARQQYGWGAKKLLQSCAPGTPIARGPRGARCTRCSSATASCASSGDSAGGRIPARRPCTRRRRTRCGRQTSKGSSRPVMAGTAIR